MHQGRRGVRIDPTLERAPVSEHYSHSSPRQALVEEPAAGGRNISGTSGRDKSLEAKEEELDLFELALGIRVQDSRCEVVIELAVRWDWLVPWWRGWLDKPDRLDYESLQREKQESLESASTRVQNRALNGEVVWVGYRGELSSRDIYDHNHFVRQHYALTATKPNRRVRITGRTKLSIVNRPETTEDGTELTV